MSQLLVALFCCFFVLFPLASNANDFRVANGDGGIYYLKTSTLRDYKFRETIKQQRDFSCGSAALATLLTYHYNRPISETEALHRMYATGDRAKILKEGFSLLDMKQYLASIGLQAEGFRESLDRLSQVAIPAIALINNKGYLHFVLIRGVTEDKVLLADPSNGMKTMGREKFESMWNNILFVIVNDTQTGRNHFNLAKHWGRPLESYGLEQIVTGNYIAPFTLHIARQPGYF